MKPRSRGVALSLSQGGEGGKGAVVLKDLPVCSGDEQRRLVGSGSGPAPGTDGLFPAVGTRPYGLLSVVHITPWPTVLSILGRRVVAGQWGSHTRGSQAHGAWAAPRQDTHISRTMTMLAFSSKASTHWTSLGWWRQFMMLISCRMFSFSFAEYALKNFPAQIFPVFFSTSRKTCPNFPL